MAAPQGFGEDDREELFASEQLVLTDGDDERLPWLEASDFDDEERGIDGGRLAGFALLLLLLGGSVGAAVWWFTQGEASAELQPEGTVIAAPAGPYKVRPADAGGKTFEGTGDTSFKVGEGQRSEGTLGASPEPTPSAAPADEPSPIPSENSEPPSGPVVQVGAYATRASAQEGWRTLMRQTDKLNGVKHRIVQGTADIGVVYRLQAVPGDLNAARQLCAALKNDGVACQVKL
ncbi:SPOR domain-containing protein [Altererythrobacter sp. MF3-039]|uniref:SPOR domain-containing protein n=1 Tax=Altererythrobacter sp. MF3-039 TaxID=3252901 RepID=UPI00390C7A8A